MIVARSFTTLLIACLMTLPLAAQDVHFSMFDMAPLTLNPAYSGAYNGTFRIGGIYRDQWRNVTSVKPYMTPNLYIDAPLFAFGKQKNSWLGAGLNILYDRRGLAALTTMGGSLNVGVHMPLTKSKKVYIHIGASGGITSDRINEDGNVFGQQYDPNNLGAGPVNPSGENLQDASVTYPDFNAGVMVDAILNQKLGFSVGFSSQHLLEPDEAFLPGGANADPTRPRKYIGHAKFDIGIGSRYALRPMAFYQLQRKASELNTQALFGIHFSQEKDITLWLGGGYRWGDAAIARLGFDYKGFKIGAAYDINVGSLSNYTNAHAFEVAVAYTAKIYPRRVLPQRLFCPRL